jgi:hypothetical protein
MLNRGHLQFKESEIKRGREREEEGARGIPGNGDVWTASQMATLYSTT